MIYEFSVKGLPQPKGSTRSFFNPRTKQVVTRSANPNLKDWEHLIRLRLQDYPHEPDDGRVAVLMHFYFARPPSVSAKKRPHHTVTPDLDKLVRGVLDAMTGIVFDDDKQVTVAQATKQYGKRSGVCITVLTGDQVGLAQDLAINHPDRLDFTEPTE